MTNVQIAPEMRQMHHVPPFAHQYPWRRIPNAPVVANPVEIDGFCETVHNLDLDSGEFEGSVVKESLTTAADGKDLKDIEDPGKDLKRKGGKV